MNASCGIIIGGGDSTLVQNCLIHDICLGGGWAGPQGIYCGGTYSTIRNNVLYNCGNIYGTTGNADGAALYFRDSRNELIINNLFYNNCQAVTWMGVTDPLRDMFVNNTIVFSQHYGVNFPGNDNWSFKNNIIWGNGTANPALYNDLNASVSGMKGWDVTYNDIGKYNDSLKATFADSVFCVGNISATRCWPVMPIIFIIYW